MLKVKNVYINLGDFQLKNINLNVSEKEYMVILGPTGAGKTILLETIAGVYIADEGKIFLNGQDISRMRPRDRNVGMVYQDYMLFPHLTVEENVQFGLKVRGYLKSEIAEKSSEMFDLLEINHLRHRYPTKLSGGEQQKTSIARALVTDPDILLLDEPLGSLDPPTREELGKELRLIHKKTGIKTIHVTHNYEEALSLGDRIAILNHGEIVQVGKPFEVFEKPKTEFIAHFVGTKNIFPAKSKSKGKIYELEFDTMKIDAVNGKEGKVTACIRPEDILISTQAVKSSGRNTIHGKIVEVSHLGAVVNISVDVNGMNFVAVITEASYSELGLNIGSEVFLTFKATSVHMI